MCLKLVYELKVLLVTHECLKFKFNYYKFKLLNEVSKK